MRKRIYEIIEVSKDNDILSKIYDSFMMIIIILSLVPLAFKQSNSAFDLIDKISAIIFIIDYIFRWSTADLKYNDKTIKSFVKYPFSLIAVIDLVSILPSITVMNSGFKVLRILRLVRTFRVFKLFR